MEPRPQSPSPSAPSTTKVIWTRPWLYPKQTAAIFCTERYGVIEASTKSGKTHGCIIWIIEQAFAGKPGYEYWWVAPVFGQAAIAYRRVKRSLTRQAFTYADGELCITLINKAVIRFKSADKPDSLYGEDVHAAVIDEASRCNEAAWVAIRSTLTATRGPVRVIGNVKGRRNWAYALARKAEAGAQDMHYSRITAHDAVTAGILNKAEVEDARRNMPSHAYQELYEAVAADDEGNPFGQAAIRLCVAALAETEPQVWGWDLAKSVDWTVGIALDHDGAVCRFHRFQKPWQETVAFIREATGNVQALVDSTGVGDPILEQLQRQAPNFEGFKFSSSAKQQLMEGLAVAIQSNKVTFPEGPILSELEQFGYEYTKTGVRYSAPSGFHDDCVCALALAVRKKSSPPLEDALVIVNERENAHDYY